MIQFSTMILQPEIIAYILGALICSNVLVLIWLIRLEAKAHKSWRGMVPKELSKKIEETYKLSKQNEKFVEEASLYLATAEKRLKRAFQAGETVRFDAFSGSGLGGAQSFATCFLNEGGDGILITSIAARERISIFSKPIKAFGSSQELSPEEKDALEKTRQSLSSISKKSA